MEAVHKKIGGKSLKENIILPFFHLWPKIYRTAGRKCLHSY
jgi:hypothetical protein